MTAARRACWRNCALETDAEMQAIDELEDGIAPLDAETARVRELITELELCHHKAARWVENIVRAIGGDSSPKGLGSRAPGRSHPVEAVWQNACAALAAWCEDRPTNDLVVDSVAASRLHAGLGERTPLKHWQVERVIDKIRSFIERAQSSADPTRGYEWILLSGGEYEAAYRADCPEPYREHEDFWINTVRTSIRDTDNGHKTELSLGLAIDMLMPCHWRFVGNLRIVLEAIGGKLDADKPYAACGRNITLVPIRREMETVCNTLKVFCGDSGRSRATDADLLTLLGPPTAVKKWLAASLDKTLRLQMNPPADIRAVSALTGPDWIRD